MSSLYKRGSVWWLETTDAEGNKHRESTGSRDQGQAQKVMDMRVPQINGGLKKAKLFDEAMTEHMVERKGTANESMDTIYAVWWGKRFNGRALHDITEQEIELAGEKKRKETSASTANHYLQFLKTFFNISGDRGTKAVRAKRWITTIPKIVLYPVDNQITRALSKSEFDALMPELPEHLKPMVEFSIETGLRQMNVLELRWRDIDISRGTILVPAVKGKKHTWTCHLTDRAREILVAQRGLHEDYVFVYAKGNKKTKVYNPISNVNNTAWQGALKRAGVKDFRWHDLRHTFATNHAHAGTPLLVLKSLGGWKTLSMVGRYANVAAEGSKGYLNNSGMRDPSAVMTGSLSVSNEELTRRVVEMARTMAEAIAQEMVAKMLQNTAITPNNRTLSANQLI